MRMRALGGFDIVQPPAMQSIFGHGGDNIAPIGGIDDAGMGIIPMQAHRCRLTGHPMHRNVLVAGTGNAHALRRTGNAFNGPVMVKLFEKILGCHPDGAARCEAHGAIGATGDHVYPLAFLFGDKRCTVAGDPHDASILAARHQAFAIQGDVRAEQTVMGLNHLLPGCRETHRAINQGKDRLVIDEGGEFDMFVKIVRSDSRQLEQFSF